MLYIDGDHPEPEEFEEQDKYTENIICTPVPNLKGALITFKKGEPKKSLLVVEHGLQVKQTHINHYLVVLDQEGTRHDFHPSPFHPWLRSIYEEHDVLILNSDGSKLDVQDLPDHEYSTLAREKM